MKLLRRLNILVALAVAVTFALLLYTELSHASEFNVAIGRSVYHTPGETSYTLGYVPVERVEFFLGNVHYNETNINFFGAEYDLCNGKKWGCGFGAMYMSDVSPFNGTRNNFSLSVTRKFSDNTFGRFRHASNGRGLGIGPSDKPNAGWHILEYGLTF